MNATEAASRLADRCKSLCEYLLPNGGVVHGEYRVGGVNGDKGQSLGICLAGTKRGLWFDFETDERGDALDLVKAVKRLGTAEAIAWSASWLGEPVNSHNGATALTINGQPITIGGKTNGAAKPAASPTAKPDDNNTKFALDLWRGANPAGPIATTYLQGRGISIAPPPSIREEEGLKHGPTGLALPAILCAIQGPDRHVVAVHRTFLKSDFSAKANVSQARMMLGPMSGNVVRLAPAAEKIALAEGLENGLSVAQSCPGLSVWCCLSVSNLAPHLPDQVTDVIMCLDGDAPDSTAFQVAERCVQELLGRGLRVRVFRAPQGSDHNDLIQLPGSTNNTTITPKEATRG